MYIALNLSICTCLSCHTMYFQLQCFNSIALSKYYDLQVAGCMLTWTGGDCGTLDTCRVKVSHMCC